MSTEEYVEAVLQYIPEYYADGMRIDVRFEGVVELYKGTGEYRVIDDGHAVPEKVRAVCEGAIKQFIMHSA